jgi:hypothetical protein
MTIPDYDLECDCDFCTEERNKRIKEFNKKMGSGKLTSPQSCAGGGFSNQEKER